MQSPFVKYCFLFFFTCLTHVGFTQPKTDIFLIDMVKLGEKEGLLGRRVQAIHQDKRGIIWVMTPAGLSRFDGREFKWYREFAANQFYDSERVMIEDEANLLWVFEHFDIKKIHPIKYLINTHTGNLISIDDAIPYEFPFKWENLIIVKAGKKGQIYFFTKNKELFIYQGATGFKKIKINCVQRIRKVYGIEEDGSIWLGASDDNKLTDLVHVDLEENLYTIATKEHPGSISYHRTTTEGRALFYACEIYNNIHQRLISVVDRKIYLYDFSTIRELPDSILRPYLHKINPTNNK